MREEIPGHPDSTSSILDTTRLAPTTKTRNVENELDAIAASNQALQSNLNSYVAAQNNGFVPKPEPTYSPIAPIPKLKYEDFGDFMKHRTKARKNARSGTQLVHTYDPRSLLKNPPDADAITLPMLLANQTHLGHHTSLWNPSNSSYIFGIREGIHIISPDITYAYLKRAAKVVKEVARRGGIILFIGTRKGQTDIIVRAAKRAGGYHIFDRWVPGTLTNGQQLLGHCAVKAVNAMDQEVERFSDSLSEGTHTVLRPDLVVCLNPIENEVCLHECGLYTVPTIGIIDTDANPTWVTYPIPANDDSHRSTALIAGVLSRAAGDGQKLRMQAALAHEIPYPTEPAQKYLKELEVLNRLSVQEERGDKDTRGGDDADQ